MPQSRREHRGILGAANQSFALLRRFSLIPAEECCSCRSKWNAAAPPPRASCDAGGGGAREKRSQAGATGDLLSELGQSTGPVAGVPDRRRGGTHRRGRFIDTTHSISLRKTGGTHFAREDLSSFRLGPFDTREGVY
jgi:hypothetical protein